MVTPKDPRNYAAALKAHIAKVPAYPGELVSSSTPHKAPYSAELKTSLETNRKKPNPNFKLAGENDDYTKVAGVAHTYEVTNWVLDGGIFTSCNSFVGACCTAMGVPNLGLFELEAQLIKLGKRHAWVPANSGERPGYGDIFTSAGRLHMGVSLGFEGDTWLTIEGGQGGRSRGVDCVKYKRQKFDPAQVLGWCDMRAFVDPRGGVPDWLAGWWMVYAGDKTWHYHFNRYFELSYMPYQPGNTKVGPAMATDTGTFSVGLGDSVVVNWRAEGGTERFKYDRFESLPGILERMTGVSNSNEPMKAAKLGR